MPAPAADIQSEYEALRTAAGVADYGLRTQVELTGKDRATFLHGFCTGDIKRLEPGQGCEAFLTNVQGKTIGFVNVFCGQDRLLVESTPGHAEGIIAALDRYLIREDVQLTDRSECWHEVLVAGPDAAARIQQITGAVITLDPLHQLQCPWKDREIAVRRVDITGSPAFLIGMDATDSPAVTRALVEAGAIPVSAAAVEIARIETGTPVFGVDITDDNLPQEVDRNATAISFTKGCYLGQETVARIDALGHVNRLLRGLRVASDEVPPPGAEFVHDGKVVATVTSACWSLRLRAPLALAYVRRSCSTPGSRLESPGGEAEVVALPLA